MKQAREKHIFPLFPPFYSKDQNKLCTYDQNRKRAELWVKDNLFNVFLIYALGSVHEKFNV